SRDWSSDVCSSDLILSLLFVFRQPIDSVQIEFPLLLFWLYLLNRLQDWWFLELLLLRLLLFLLYPHIFRPLLFRIHYIYIVVAVERLLFVLQVYNFRVLSLFLLLIRFLLHFRFLTLFLYHDPFLFLLRFLLPNHQIRHILDHLIV